MIASKVTATKSITVPLPFEFGLEARGDGSGTLKIILNAKTNPATVYVTGSAKMYTNEAGDAGECTSKSISASAYLSGTSMWIRLASGTAKIYFKTKQVNEVLIAEGTSPGNAPKLTGDFSNMTNLRALSLATRCNLNSSLTKLTGLRYTVIGCSNNEGAITGDVSGLVISETLSLIDYSSTRIAGSSIRVSGNLEGFTQHPILELVDDEGRSNYTGDLTDVDPKLLYNDALANCTGTIDAWTNCYYLECNTPLTINTAVGMTKCGYFQPTGTVMTTAQVNQILADFWANRATAKTYGDASRTLDLTGADGTGAPSGQGLVDKQNLIDYVGAGGEHFHVTTR